jgi:hypothetical protein
MYATLWKLLPGDRGTKALTCLGLVLVMVALLWYVVFPWLEPKIQFDHSEVQVRSSVPATSPAPHR